MLVENKIKVRKQNRTADIVAESWNEEEKSFEAKFVTENQVRMRPWFSEPFDEILSLDRGHYDFDDLNKGAPFLDSHSRFSANGVLGVVERAWESEKEGFAKIRLDWDDPEAQKLGNKIKKRIVRNP